MRACAELIVGPGAGTGQARIERMVHAAPIGWRVTPDAVYLVGTSASPVADDDIAIEVEVRAGARLVVRSSAATVAWRGCAGGSRQRVAVRIGAGASLDWSPEPLIATAGCDHRQEVRISMACGSALRWEERLILGRHGEQPGRLTSTLRVDVDGAPLLRHTLSVGVDAPGWEGPAVLGGRRAVGLVLVAGPDLDAQARCGDGWACMPLAGPGSLTVAVAQGSPGLDRLLHGRRPPVPVPARAAAAVG